MKKLQFVVLMLLLLTLIASNMYLAVLTYQDRQVQLIRAESMQPLLERHRQAIDGILATYREVAYNNPDIDRIAEQQLIATEHQMYLLRTLAHQNVLMLELLTDY